MKISEINPENIDNNLIKKMFFSIQKEEYKSADYLVIYGCHIKEWLDERLEHALKILKTKEIKNIVLTGGIGVKGDFNESKYMLDFLVKNGINKERIIIENKSTTTEENNTNIMKMLNLQNVTKPTKIVLITNEIHMLRIMMHWQKLLNNENIHFFYEFVTDSKLKYERVINDPYFKNLFKEQVVKTKKFISDGIYVDMDI